MWGHNWGRLDRNENSIREWTSIWSWASSSEKKGSNFGKTTGQPIINKEGRLCSILPWLKI
jgi:hypothetical protein